MAIHAVDKTLTQFLNPNENIIYKIPTYQREYSWRPEHCQTLLNDIIENDPKYFIGSIIWIKDTKEIIDGQQRLTSLCLLLLAIYQRLDDFELNEDLIFKKSSIKRMLVKEDFEYLIKEKILREPTGGIPKNFGNRRVSHNYSEFEKAIEKFDLKELYDLYEKICLLTFISAEVDDVQTAFTLFETMNNRGMELSAIDLIKNTYMSKNINDIDNNTLIDNWENLISILGNENNQEQFLRNNYNAFRKEYNNINGLVTQETRYQLSPKATKSNVIKIYSDIVTRPDFMDFITINAKYNSLLTGEESPTIEVSENLKSYFEKFRTANATSSFLLLLYLLRNQIPFNINDDQMCLLFELILRFLIRRNLTNFPSTGALPQIFMGIISDINSIETPTFDYIYQILLNTFRNRTSNDITIKEILSGDIYETNRDMARYLLCSLCVFKDHNERKFINLWEKNDSEKYIWTIEHILPEGNRDASNTPKDWIEMIRNGDSNYSNKTDAEIIDLIKKYRHKIGNLTMTGYNSTLSNASFDIKKNRKNENNEPIGYNNGLSLNDYVYKQNAWHIDNIEERTKFLVENILSNLVLE